MENVLLKIAYSGQNRRSIVKLGIVPITDIDFGDRSREDYGDIEGLASDIERNELICPIAIWSDTGDPPYVLAAGGRRYLAHISLAKFEIACRIYDKPLSELDFLLIELAENIHRKELDHMEKCNLSKKIDDLYKKIEGEKTSTSPDADGWSMRDTADFIGKSPATVSLDISLAKAHEEMPELELDKCKNQAEATKKLKRVQETIVRKGIAERASKVLKDEEKKFIDKYMVGDFFDLIKKVPDNSMNLVEIDPPYGIDIQSLKKFDKDSGSHDAMYGDSYNEISAQIYPQFVEKVLDECWPKMTDNSWLIFWFGPEPWFETIYGIIEKVGFKTRRITAHWQKPNGQTMQPDIYLANTSEQFFYARKGNPTIAKKGRSNEFRFDPVPPAQKIHETERPVELLREILSTFCWEGSRVLVPFLGSGNTHVAARDEKMFSLGFDLTKEYKEAFVARYYSNKGGKL